METSIFIPARKLSKRFPNKALALLSGHNGVKRPLVEWSWLAACRAFPKNQVIVAVDCEEIAECVSNFGGQFIMTDPDLRNGTERCAAVVEQLDEKPDIIVNLQGDSPLVPPEMIHNLLAKFDDPKVQIATPFVSCDEQMQARLLDDFSKGVIGGTCAVTDSQERALYFSKYPIPFGATTRAPLKMHIGLYAYRKEALLAYRDQPPSHAEMSEGLEQLRFLDAGIPIQMAEVALPKGGIWEVNHPQDIAVVEPLLPI